MNQNLALTLNDEHGNIQSSLDYFLKFNIPKKAKILDVGSGYGSLIFNLYKLGYTNVYGIDVRLESIKKGKESYLEITDRINYYEGDHIPYDDNSFDVVIMFDVIEHIPGVNDFLKKQVYRVLKSGGNFIFQTPNKIINIPWEIISNKSFTKWKKYHCSLQTPKSLKKMLIKINFYDIKIEKGNILNKYNRNKVYKKMGKFGVLILYFIQQFPLFISPNMWGNCKK